MAEERNKPVKITLGDGALRLAASSSDLGEAEETLDVDYKGDEITIGFNSPLHPGLQRDDESDLERREARSGARGCSAGDAAP
jgi:hypothetical protein